MRSHSGISRARLGRAALAGLAALVLRGAALPVAAQEDAEPVPLERLLKLPDSYGTGDGERRAGATAPEWRERFEDAQGMVVSAHKDLKSSQAELRDAAAEGVGWQAGVPLGGPVDAQNNTISYKLRLEIRERREQLESAQKKLFALQVEADLADVPDNWRE